MKNKCQALGKILLSGVGDCFTAASAVVIHHGKVIFEQAVGTLNPEDGGRPAALETLFDLASLTKIFVSTAFLRLVEEELIDLDTRVSDVIEEFTGIRPIVPFENPLSPGEFVKVAKYGYVDAEGVTFRHILSHSAGLPGWKPLYKLGSPERIIEAVVDTDFAYIPGTDVVYSDIGFILLGLAIEKLTGMRLDAAVSRYITAPYRLSSIGYGPVPKELAAATEYCSWRGKRMQGEVHDENAWALGGVSGHAGLFGNAVDVARFGQLWLDSVTGESVLLESWLAQEAVSLQAEKGSMRRGLGWALWSPSKLSPSYPLGHNTFGHTGFTGTSLYIDPDKEIVVALLTNRVFYGRDARKIREFRLRFHSAVLDAVR